MRRALVPLVAVLLLVPAASARAEIPVLGPLLGDSEEGSEQGGGDGARPQEPSPEPDAPAPAEGGASPSDAPEEARPSGPPPGEQPGREGAEGRLPTGDAGAAEAAPGPGRTWTMTAEKLTLEGSRFHGTSQEQVAGRTVTTLHFTADRLAVRSLVQRSDLGNGRELRVASAPGAVSTVSGPVEMQVRELSGTLDVAGFPLVPVVLSAEAIAPPDVDLSFLRLPSLTFDDVTVRTVELNAGQLHVPDASTSLQPAG